MLNIPHVVEKIMNKAFSHDNRNFPDIAVNPTVYSPWGEFNPGSVCDEKPSTLFSDRKTIKAAILTTELSLLISTATVSIMMYTLKALHVFDNCPGLQYQHHNFN